MTAANQTYRMAEQASYARSASTHTTITVAGGNDEAVAGIFNHLRVEVFAVSSYEMATACSRLADDPIVAVKLLAPVIQQPAQYD
jgi:hypothetical protein